VHAIRGVAKSRAGMETLTGAVLLYEEGKISYEEALKNADSVNDLRLRIKLKQTVTDRNV